ncbi:cop9 signalosome complex subunit 4 [Moniliophthora roreri]|nr:cop9 signalosome complex subunit 4 [Moniliophthora roreri]
MEAQLSQVSALDNKSKPQALITIINSVVSRTDTSAVATDLHTVVDYVVNQESVGLVVGRQVLSELVKMIGEGAITDPDVKKRVVEDTISTVQPKIVSYEEQVSTLRFQLADILENEEEWSEAARVLMAVPLESSQRQEAMPDSEKMRIYVRIVRLLLEDEDSTMAETYFNRAQGLVHSANNRETILQFKLCQARISDYTRKFLEAARGYHELSYAGEIDEEERRYMLLAAVTCAVLAPAGPNRSRILASLYRDERTSELPTYNILSKMFFDHILRSAEIQEFEKTLKPHQLAKIALSSNDHVAAVDDDEPPFAELSGGARARKGPTTVLDRAVMEHNLLACSQVYNNITFRGLGALLDLTPAAAETMARRMIEQGRLRGSIDQVDKLIWFEKNREEDDAQGQAGGLGDVEKAEDTGAPFTKRWDAQIRVTAANVESIVHHLAEKGLIRSQA